MGTPPYIISVKTSSCRVSEDPWPEAGEQGNLLYKHYILSVWKDNLKSKAVLAQWGGAHTPEGTEVQGQRQLHKELEASLGYKRPNFKTIKIK